MNDRSLAKRSLAAFLCFTFLLSFPLSARGQGSDNPKSVNDWLDWLGNQVGQGEEGGAGQTQPPEDPDRCRDKVLQEEDRKRLADFGAALQADETRYRDALQLKKELSGHLSRARIALQGAIGELTVVGKREEILEESLEKAKLAEDILGLLSLAAVAGKASFMKKILGHPSSQKIFANSPKKLLALERTLKALGSPVPDWAATAMTKMDALRLQAVADTLNRLPKVRRNTVITGSGKKVFQTLEDGTVAVRQEILDGKKIEGWKGIASDIDLQIPARYEKRFTSEVNRQLKEKLKPFGEVLNRGELQINTFTGNLSRLKGVRDLSDGNQLKTWSKALYKRKYLEEPDAFRTFGAQKLADYFSRPHPAEILFTRKDGADIIREMRHRADLTWKNKSYVDLQVYKDVLKCFERALAGVDIATEKARSLGTVLKDGKEAADLKANALSGLKTLGMDEKFYLDAKELAENGKFDRPTAEKMRAMLGKLDDEYRGVRHAEVPNARDQASDMAGELLDYEAGKIRELPLARKAGIDEQALSEVLQAAGKKARANIRIGQGLVSTLLDVRPSAYATAGLSSLSSWIGNPWSMGAMAVATQWKFDEGFFEQARNASALRLNEANRHLLEADGVWKGLDGGFDALRQAHEKHGEDLNRLIESTPADRRNCFELLGKGALRRVDSSFQEVNDYVTRVRAVQGAFPQYKQDFQSKVSEHAGQLRQQLQDVDKRLQEKQAEFNELVIQTRGHLPMSTTLEFQRQIGDLQKEHQELLESQEGAQLALQLMPESLRFSDLGKALLKGEIRMTTPGTLDPNLKRRMAFYGVLADQLDAIEHPEE